MSDPAVALPEGLTVRRLAPDDDIAGLTALLHRGYASLAARGFRFLASHQDEGTTRARCARGECYLLVDGRGRVAGTITFVPPEAAGGTSWYDRPDVASFTQFTVDPPLQRCGAGSALLALAEWRARECGAAEIACDTAEGAADLIGWYLRRGYRVAGEADWRPATNYMSVVLSKALA